jgi:ribosome-binding factor A
MSKRIERVNSLIQEELGKIILKEIELPVGVLATITRVETSIDLCNARIYVSVLPQDKLERVLYVLNKMVYVLQKCLNECLRMRPIPKIRFVKERQTAEAAKIEGILEELKIKK